MNALRSLRIGARLAVSFSAILLILIAAVAVGVWRMEVLEDESQELGNVDMEMLASALEWGTAIDKNWIRTQAVARDTGTANMDKWKKEIDATSTASAKVQEKVVALLKADGRDDLLKAVDERRAAYRPVRDDIMKRKTAGETVPPDALLKLEPAADAYGDSVDAVVAYIRTRVTNSVKNAKQTSDQSQMVLVGGGTISVVLSAVLAILLTRSIVAPVRQATISARRIADGDLTERIVTEGKDEAADLLKALSNMQGKLNAVVSNVRENSEAVATASSQIAQGNNDLSSRTEQQASALEETAASMEQLGSPVKLNAENARSANQMAMNASEIAGKGGDVVARVVETMKGIDQSSKKISDIIGVIDGIAFQTNILALNAAVEAARAGEQGRGFAVVAVEVRTLAQRSASAAKEIKSLIADSVERVGVGSALVDQAGTTMGEVVNSIKRVTDLMGEISAASSEQSAGVSQVGEAVMQMDQVTQQNAALVEQSAAAASSLKEQAVGLVQAVAVFKLNRG